MQVGIINIMWCICGACSIAHSKYLSVNDFISVTDPDWTLGSEKDLQFKHYKSKIIFHVGRRYNVNENIVLLLYWLLLHLWSSALHLWEIVFVYSFIVILQNIVFVQRHSDVQAVYNYMLVLFRVQTTLLQSI